VVLHAATDAADTDWTALNVADGIVRARYRNGVTAPEPITPGAPVEYRISLVATSRVFKAGHSVRVDVASSNFPRFDRNPGNGTLSAEATDAERPSHILLPLIPRV